MSTTPASLRLPHVAILGAGSMGAAVVSGLQRPGVAVDGIRATVWSRASAAALEAAGVAAFAAEVDPEANRRAVAGAGIVVLAVKPAQLPEVLEAVAPELAEDAIVVSVAAGVTTARMEALTNAVVIRAMPNTPALVGLGMTGIAAGSRAAAEHLALVRALFETVGRVIVVDEARIDAVTAISGSGPAYVFHAIESWMSAAETLGFSAAEARLLVGQTFLGASQLLETSGEAPSELRRRVTSPGGTTAAAVAVLDQAGLAQTYAAAAGAAVARAKELGA